MQLLANENFPLVSVHLLRQEKYDIAAITEESPGIEDSEVLARAVDEQRIILTFDGDYGELIYRLRLPAPTGVIYLRFRPHTPEEPAAILLDLFQTEGFQIDGRFTIIERDRIRQRPLP
jgi:predicted nuclease of predicted toxin-antitoxin system